MTKKELEGKLDFVKDDSEIWERMSPEAMEPYRFLVSAYREALQRGLNRFKAAAEAFKAAAKKYPDAKIGRITGVPIIVTRAESDHENEDR